MKYRHELKYYISNADIPVLKQLLSTVMEPDSHQGEDGYTITSLYFDTIYNMFYDENNAGTNTRDKIRIRKYNGNNEVLKLEIKSKEYNLCLKRSQTINEEQCRIMMNYPYCYAQPSGNTVFDEVLAMNETKCLKPAAIIEYDRYAFVHLLGNVRITFDQKIRSSSSIDSFLDNDYICLPAIEEGLSILEVKYDEILPGFIANLLNNFNLNQTKLDSMSSTRV